MGEKSKFPWIAIIGFLLGAAIAVFGVTIYLHVKKIEMERDQATMEAQAIKENLKSALEEKNRLSKSKQNAERIAESTSDLLNQAYAEIAKKPELPVSLNVRKALTGNGLVVQFTNRSDKYLSVIARFENPTTRETETVRLDLTPMGTKEIGHLEGWAFSSSDVIHLQHNDYASISMAIQ